MTDMKHHCHCHFREQLRNFKAGKLGLLGGFLIVGHLLFHVAECLVLPALLVAFNHHDAEAADELTAADLPEVTFATTPHDGLTLQTNFYDTLEIYYPLKR